MKSLERFSLAMAILAGILLLSESATAQVGIGTASPDSSAMLDVFSTERGMLVPRMIQNHSR